jgi:hydroxylaminobenzene mutase
MDTLLIQLGILLFLMGLLTGFVIPKFANPRMGLASHLEGVLNGMFLVALGLLWQRLNVSNNWLLIAFWLAIYSAFANWLATLLAAIWKAGSALMPMAAHGSQGLPYQESVINFLLITLSIAMLAVCAIVIVGLRTG